MIFDLIAFSGNSDHITGGSHTHIGKDAALGHSAVQKLIQLLRLVFHHRHGLCVDLRAVISFPDIVRLDLNRLGRLAGLKDRAELVEPGAGEVHLCVLCLCKLVSFLVQDQNIIHLEKVCILLHLRVAHTIALVIFRQKADALNLRLIDRVICGDGILPFLVCF